MDLAQSRSILEQVRAATPSGQWGTDLGTAVQRALAELYLLNPNDDVDGQIGARTRAAWGFFKEATNLPDPDILDAASTGKLLQALDSPAGLIGKPIVDLQPDFEFRQNQAKDNRDKSVAAIVAAARARKLSNPQIAYVLATAEHESDSFKTLEEYSSGTQYEGRADLGNTTAGDGVRFKGRGYVQLTGRLNYTRYTEIAGLQLARLPIMVMNWPALSVFIIVDGMVRGIYTGRRLSEFVDDTRQDFVNARRVINGLDRADKIAGQASDWLRQLG
jgi:predicted chitinase